MVELKSYKLCDIDRHAIIFQKEGLLLLLLRWDFPGRRPRSCRLCHGTARGSANCKQAVLDMGNCPLACNPPKEIGATVDQTAFVLFETHVIRR